MLAELPRSLATALCVIPPEEFWAPMQAVRERHDRAFARWPPHVNVLFPFVIADSFGDVAEALAPVLADTAPFTLTFASLGAFVHGKKASVHVRPDGAEPLVALHQQLRPLFPQSRARQDPADGSSFAPLTPHLTLAQFGARDYEGRMAALQEAWEPFSFEVTHLSLVARDGKDTPMEERMRLPLGGADRS